MNKSHAIVTVTGIGGWKLITSRNRGWLEGTTPVAARRRRAVFSTLDARDTSDNEAVRESAKCLCRVESRVYLVGRRRRDVYATKRER